MDIHCNCFKECCRIKRIHVHSKFLKMYAVFLARVRRKKSDKPFGQKDKKWLHFFSFWTLAKIQHSIYTMIIFTSFRNIYDQLWAYWNPIKRHSNDTDYYLSHIRHRSMELDWYSLHNELFLLINNSKIHVVLFFKYFSIF